MADALAGTDAPGLHAHLAACPACGGEWEIQAMVDRWFGARPLDEAPEGFVDAVLARLEHEILRIPAWQRSLMQIGVIASGVIAAASTAAVVVHGAQSLVYAPLMIAWLEAVIDGLRAASSVVLGGTARDVAWLWLSLILAAALAVAWFGILVVPRAIPVARRAHHL